MCAVPNREGSRPEGEAHGGGLPGCEGVGFHESGGVSVRVGVGVGVGVSVSVSVSVGVSVRVRGVRFRVRVRVSHGCGLSGCEDVGFHEPVRVS